MLRRTVGEASPNRVVVRLDMDYSCAAQRLVVQIGFELREASDIERTADTGEGRHHGESIPGIELLDQFGILQSVIDGAVSQLQACKVVDRPVEDLQLRGLHVQATAGRAVNENAGGPSVARVWGEPAVADAELARQLVQVGQVVLGITPHDVGWIAILAEPIARSESGVVDRRIRTTEQIFGTVAA